MKKTFRLLLSTLLLVSISTPMLADTIRLKDGSVIRGQVIGFKDQQFTILIGANSRGRRGQTTVMSKTSNRSNSTTTAVTAVPRAASTTVARGTIRRQSCRDPRIQTPSLTTPIPVAQSTQRLFRLQLRLSLRSKSALEPITQTMAGQTAVSSCAKDSDCGLVLRAVFHSGADVFPRRAV